MADFDENTVKQIQELMQASSAAKQKGLASEVTLETVSKNIAAMAKEMGVQTASPEKRKQTQNLKDSNEALESHTEAAERNTSKSQILTRAFDELRFSGIGATQSVGDFAGVLNYVGDRMGGTFELVFRGLSTFTQMLEDQIQTFRNINQVGVSFGESINDSRRIAGELGVSLDVLQNAVIQGSRAFALLGGSADQGAQIFKDAFNKTAFQDTILSLTAVGFTMDEIAGGMSDFLELQTEIGRGQRMTAMQLAQESGKFLMNLDLLSKATGRQRKEILDQMQRDTRDDRLRSILGGMADGGQEVLKMLSVLETSSPEMANNVKDLIANMGIPQNAAQAGLVANSNIQSLLRDMISGEGSVTDVMAEFARLGKGSADLTMEQRRLFTFLNAQGNGFYNYNIQLANAGKLFEQYQAAQKLQDAQVRKNTDGALQFDRAVMKLRARFAALTTFILDFLDPMFGVFATAIEGIANMLEGDFSKALEGTAGLILGLGVAVVGVIAAMKALKAIMSFLPGIGSIGMKGGGAMLGGMKAIGAGGAAFGKGAALAGLGAGVGVGGFAALAGGGIAAGLFLVGKSLNVLAEGLERVQAIDGSALKDTADGTKMLASAIIDLGGAQLEGGVSGFFGKLFGGGTENFAKSINKTLDQLDKDKIDVYATSINNLGESMQSLSTGMQSVTTGASKSTGDKLDQLNTTMQEILYVLGSSNRYMKVTARSSTEVAENI
tara:strand:- start:179 stop:2347 length:2169 start_codon:yes stop_codon:yes gene_type:complete